MAWQSAILEETRSGVVAQQTRVEGGGTGQGHERQGGGSTAREHGAQYGMTNGSQVAQMKKRPTVKGMEQ